jgi:hypothetical protein
MPGGRSGTWTEDGTVDHPPAPGDRSDPRTLRLFDLTPHEVVEVVCTCCGRIVEYGHRFLARHHRIASDTLVYDLQFKLRCKHCNLTDGFEISVVDKRHLGDSSKKPMPRIVIVPRKG